MRVDLILQDVRQRQLPLTEQVEVLGYLAINGFACAIVCRFDGTIEAVPINRLKGEKYEPKRTNIGEVDGNSDGIRMDDRATTAGHSTDGQFGGELPPSESSLRVEKERVSGSVPLAGRSGKPSTKRATNKRQE